MKEISLNLPEIASLMEKVSPFLPSSCNHEELVGKALALTEIPEGEILSVVTRANTIEDCIDKFWSTKDGKTEKGAIRRAVDLCLDFSDLRWVHKEIMNAVEPESYEMMHFIRRMAEVA